MKKVQTRFVSRGEELAGTLYLPGTKNPPVVVMAHGFGAAASYGLLPFAKKFVARGMAAFVFDYRGFGKSGGEPRNWVSPRRHLWDWKAAVAHVRQHPAVDRERVALWGTSFSGGHVLVTAAKTPAVRCVVSQVPFVDGRSALLLNNPLLVARAIREGLRDLARAARGQEPVYIPLAGAPGSLAALNQPGCLEGFMALVPDEEKAQANRVTARSILEVPFYRPLSFCQDVTCPTLMILAENDNLIPARSVQHAAAVVEKARLVSLPVEHFDVYFGEVFEKVAKLEADFLEEHLSPKKAKAPSRKKVPAKKASRAKKPAAGPKAAKAKGKDKAPAN
ncbi:MAG: alpha/beta fold hydrolase [Deltaproteobacteria bacterium]|nr:alpha/beta fold hydrolase [Deltaproteobacteria bacterium]